MTHFLQYWKLKQVDYDKHFEPIIEHSASEQLHRVKVDDVVWIVTVRNGKLSLIGRILVGECIGRREAEKRFQDVYSATYHIIAKQGTEEELREISIMDIAKELRFDSSTGRDRLKLKNRRVDGKQLQKMRKLTPETVELLELKWYGKEVSVELEIEQQISSGAGFGNSEKNKEVEKAAVCFVTDLYKKNEWKVESVEGKKCGYDLVCSKNGTEENVEVKGISGTELSFIITANEVKQAETNPKFKIYVVTSALSNNPKARKFTGTQFNEEFNLQVIAYKATRQKTA